MTYSTFLHESFVILRSKVPNAADAQALQAWLDEVRALLAPAPLWIQLHWIDLYATVLMIENGGVHPALALAMVKQAVASKQQALR